MSGGQEACFLSVAGQARLIRTRELSPVEVVESVLRQIERVDPKVNAFITVPAEEALAEARAAEREIVAGGYRGPMHGIPISLKDLIDTRGVRTTSGSKILQDYVPTEDATVVARLREAGAVIVGKNNLHEFASGATNINRHFGDACNPWDLSRISGGSSGGSGAAVATGMGSASLGTDTGGSIRIPAALCGVVGLKPTYGRVSRQGVFPASWSLDHVGPLTRTAEDAALVLGAIAGWDPKDQTSCRELVPDFAAQLHRDPAGIRVAVLQEYATETMEPDVASGFEAALKVLQQLGMRAEEVSVPLARYAVCAGNAISMAEASVVHEEFLRTRAEDYCDDVRVRRELGFLISATDYLKGQQLRGLMIERFRELFRSCDVVVCPTEPVTASRRDQSTVMLGGVAEPVLSLLSRFTRLFNLTGLPAVSVPCGVAGNGLPIALQIVAAPFAEGTALAVAHAYQRATGWHLRMPPVAESG